MGLTKIIEDEYVALYGRNDSTESLTVVFHKESKKTDISMSAFVADTGSTLGSWVPVPATLSAEELEFIYNISKKFSDRRVTEWRDW